MKMSKLLLPAAVLVAWVALAAPGALAEDVPVEVEDRATGVMCDDTGLGECQTDISADLATLQVHTFFGEFSYVCDINMPVHVRSDGHFTTESVTILNETGSTGNCGDLGPCELQWEGQLHEEAGSEFLDVTICRTNGLVTCEGVLHWPALTDTGTGYAAEIQDIEIEGDPNCEFSGDYSMDGIEIHH
jgi:hypothetical protein